jgi:MscS family membrane protein
MSYLSDFFAQEVLGIALWVYAAAFAAILLGFTFKKIVSILFVRLLKVAEKTKIALDDVVLFALAKPAEWAVVLAGIFIALLILPLPEEPVNIAKFTRSILTGASVWLVIWFAMRLADGLCDIWAQKASQTETKLDDQLVPIVKRSSKVFLFVIGVVLVLQNMGYSVGSLLAGLGIGGVAVAMASKDTVANWFGSLVIFLDKPFQIGDWIEMGDTEGTVEEVGLRTTRVRTFANSLITIPNLLFTSNPVNNWSRMKKRRIKMTVGITYSASARKVDQLVKKIREIIENDEKIRNDFYLVYFDNFGPSSLDIFIYCFTITTNWADFLQAKQEFMLKIMDCVKELDLEFAFPTQTVHVESLPDEAGVPTSQRPM